MSTFPDNSEQGNWRKKGNRPEEGIRPGARRVRWARPGQRALHAPILRGGFTLVELMVVLLVMMLITAITIPAVAPALSGRRIREAARMVNVFFSGARNRAIQTSRPYGVMVERQAGLPGASITLSYAEVPLPYAGDFENSTVRLSTISSFGQPVAQIGVTFSVGSISDGLIRAGDELKVNYQGVLYRVTTFNDGNSDGYFDLNGLSDGDNDGYYDYNSAWPMTVTVILLPFGTDPWPPRNSVTPPVPFQFIRQPIKAADGTLQLPETTVIDLGGFDPSNNPVPASGFDVGDVGTFRYNNTLPNPPGDRTPIIVIFTPSGSVDRVYRWDPTNFNTGWQARVPLGPIYFLIGKREKVDGDPTAPPGLQYNMQDLANLWVVIDPQSGMISSAENAQSTGWDVYTARRIAREMQSMGGR